LGAVVALVAAGLALAAGVAALAPADAEAQGLRAGAGRADITPPTGYYMMGWVRSDAAAEGQHTVAKAEHGWPTASSGRFRPRKASCPGSDVAAWPEARSPGA
jgi:hypothetical protein